MVAQPSRDCDIEVSFGSLALGEVAACRELYNTPRLRVLHVEEGYHFAYPDAEFLVSGNGRHIVAHTPESSSVEDTCTYLVGPVVGFAMRLHGIVSLHASVVAIDGKAVALCGAPGAGKSSSAAGLARLGYPVIAEDVGALQETPGGFNVQPGYPRVNLWPDSARSFAVEGEPLPAITPNWGKKYLPLTDAFYPFAAPLSAIYILEPRSTEVAATFRPLGPMEALIALAGNTYTNYVLDASMRQREFDVLNRIISTLPVRAVSAPHDLARLSEFCGDLVNDFRRQ